MVPTTQDLFPGWSEGAGVEGFALAVMKRRGIFFPWSALAHNGQMSRSAGQKMIGHWREKFVEHRHPLPVWFRKVGTGAPHPLACMCHHPHENGWEVHPAAKAMGALQLLGGYHARIDPGVKLVRPLVFGEAVVIRSSSRVTGPGIIGDRVRIGGSMVVSRSVICGGVTLEGEEGGSELKSGGIIGDALIGHNAHIGAGVIFQSEPDDGSKEIVIHDFRSISQPEIRTGRRVLGPIIGDHCRVFSSLRAGTVLMPGTIVPMGLDLPPGIYNRDIVAEFVKMRRQEVMGQFRLAAQRVLGRSHRV